MSRHVGRLALGLLILVGLAVHIGLGYRVGLLAAGVGLLGHVALAVGARKALRRRRSDA
ncbi:hypothetical protein ACQPYE_21845 [Actinosynnema sp. CA-299493]